ncbi:MAG: hypothetical protein ACREF9_16870, partial [Opitutaceae bacterium]
RSDLAALISSSPDGTRFVARAKYSDGIEREGLIIRDVTSQNIVQSMRRRESELQSNARTFC